MKFFLTTFQAILLIATTCVAQNNTDSTKIITLNKNTISIIGVGDIMLGSNFPSDSYLPANEDCEPVMADVKEILLSADLTIGNLEGSFSNDAPLVKRCKDTTICYAFRMPEKFAGCFKDVGFDVLTIANNHSGDFGDLGRRTTVKLLDSLGIYHAGWIQYPTTIFIKDSIKYGIASFAPNSGTVNINDTIGAKKIIAELRNQCDIVIATFHGGAEGSAHQHITRKTEEFYGENRGNVYEFSHLLIDAGADVVFGHGPHVPRAVELYKNKFIAYSLGNFCTVGQFNTKGPNGLAPIVKLEISRDGNFVSGQIISAKQPGKIGTFRDESHSAAKLIRQLTLTDFSESQIKIDEFGIITQINLDKP